MLMFTTPSYILHLFFWGGFQPRPVVASVTKVKE